MTVRADQGDLQNGVAGLSPSHDMELAALMVAEISAEIARLFCLMGTAKYVRAQLERLAAQIPWMRNVTLQPNMPGPAFVAACGHRHHPGVPLHRRNPPSLFY
jgi:hypothetical protein